MATYLLNQRNKSSYESVYLPVKYIMSLSSSFTVSLIQLRITDDSLIFVPLNRIVLPLLNVM